MNAFWRGNGAIGKGIRWMAWTKLCGVKEAGGLGFKSLGNFNLSMLAKQGWRLENNVNSLVTNLMKARYFPNSDFLNATLGNNPSYMWRSLMLAHEMVKQGCRRRIGDEASTRIWNVPWLPCRVNDFLTTQMPVQLQDACVQNLIDDSHRE
ncbi:putative mitochondrial protein AtMg00310 [Apium graveolens]|uniref:putative mitochondrial protein AtMg00310 n=1 Tax=Apium graveolens TaxID=4045 RepID=UPI003D791DC4